jgi:hypothetical protein
VPVGLAAVASGSTLPDAASTPLTPRLDGDAMPVVLRFAAG